MDKIELANVSFYGYHGVSPQERKKGQNFLMDLELVLNLADAARADDLAKTVDYQEVFNLVNEVQEARRYNLIEALAQDVAREILQRFKVDEVMVRIKKPGVSLGGPLDYVAVEVRRQGKDEGGESGHYLSRSGLQPGRQKKEY